MKILGLFSLAFLLGVAANGEALAHKVLIIGVDGTRPDALAVAHTPNLDQVKSNGCYTVRAVTHPVTHSAACWSSMFTGVWGDKHGVNDPNNSFSGNQFATYPSFFKRLKAANSNLTTVCLARWAPLLNVVPDADVKLSFGSDAAITEETCRRLTNSNPDVFYTILLDVDSAGHSYGWGPTVTNYVRAIEVADGRIGQMLNALKRRPAFTNEDWLIIVLTDHGEHDHPDPEKSRITWHILSGPSAARGVIWPAPGIVDICATVLTHMGVSLNPAWNLDARVEGLPLPPPLYGSNLVFNGDAEWNSGTNNYTPNRGIAWWFDISSTTLGSYGAHARFPALTASGPLHRGANFFLGGTTNGSISQRIDLSEMAADVEELGVNYLLAGWFGGAGAEADTASLCVRFLDAAGVLLGSDVVGNVTAGERANATGLLERSVTGTLPTGTRFAELILTNQVVVGMNDGSADNLSLVLTPKAKPSVSVSAYAGAPDKWRVEFASRLRWLYVLERSQDLDSWTGVTVPIPGSGKFMVLTDTNAPFSGAFYRVSCRWP